MHKKQIYICLLRYPAPDVLPHTHHEEEKAKKPDFPLFHILY